MSAQPEVSTIDPRRAEVVLQDGTVLPVTDWFDDDGEECGWESAVSCVAGPLPSGEWLSIDLDSFDFVTIH